MHFVRVLRFQNFQSVLYSFSVQQLTFTRYTLIRTFFIVFDTAFYLFSHIF